MKVELENLTKQWGEDIGVDSISLDIEDGKFIVFLGPSGCGKTTTLLMVAGIYKPTAGIVRFDGRIVNKILPKDRNIGMVFQSYALYPHMTTFQNISYPLRLKKTPKSEIKERVQRVADMMGIGNLLDRKPANLSGGQQQRVALGRALIKEPGLLLFDEPLSNLDARRRLSMRSEIKRLQIELGITSIYVTHDQVEAMTMADRIAVMKDGHLHAYDTPDEVYDRPRTLFIAQFVGNPPMNIFPVQLSRSGRKIHAKREGIDLIIPPVRGEKALGEDDVLMGIRPEDVAIRKKGINSVVYSVETLGRDHLVDAKIGESHFYVLANPSLNLKSGDNIKLEFNTDESQFFDAKSERSLLWN